MIWTALLTKLVGTLLAAYGFGLLTPISWPEIALVWAYAIGWSFLTDWTKVLVYRHFGLETPRHQDFLTTLRRPITPHACSTKGSGR